MPGPQQKITQAVVREAPQVVSVTREAWQEFMNRPGLRDVLTKFDAVPTTGGKMSIRLAGEAEADSLAARLQAETTPPSGAGDSLQVDPAKFTMHDTVDPAKLPARVSSPGAANGATPPDADVPWNKPQPPLADVLKKGAAGAALVGGAAYGASKLVGSDDGSQPARTAPTPAGDASGSSKTQASVSGPTKPADEAAKGREVTKVKPVFVATPKAFDEELASLKSEMDAVSKNTEWTQQDEDVWNQKVADLQAVADAAEKRNMWAETAESIGHALTQFFAAKQGLATGVDMSGLKFQKTDWARKLDQITDRLKTDTGLVSEQRRNARDTVKSAREALDRLRGRYSDVSVAKARAEQSASEANASAALKAATANQDADLGLIRVESDEKRDAAKIDAKTRAALLTTLGANIKDDKKKQAAFRRVISKIQISKKPDDLNDKDVRAALAEYINGDLGDQTDFEAVLPNVDTNAWESNSEQKANWVRELEGKTGLTVGSSVAGVGMIKMFDPKTGRTGEVPLAGVEQAIKDGLVKVD